MKNIGKAVKLLRQTHNLKQKDLAKITGLSKAYISEIENARTIPSLDAFSKIAMTFEIKVSEIMLVCEWYNDPKAINDSDTVTSVIHPKILAMMKVFKAID